MTCNAASQSFEIKEEETGIVVPGIWAASMFAGLMGIRSAYAPPVGSRVHFVFTNNQGYALGSSPVGKAPAAAARTRTMLGSKDENMDDTVLYKADKEEIPNHAHNPPVDLLEGEFDLTNMMGVGISLLTGLAKLSAGDLAKVEVCLLNDMVRIVSHTFKHFNSLGSHEIYNDGRLNLRWTGTSYDHEACGQKLSSDKKADVEQGEIDLSDVDKIEDTLRARFSHFVGFLGDFINTYVTDPGQALGDIASDRRSGKFRAHVGNDGTLLVQSVAEIAFERVVRIPIPIEKKRHDDPAGNTPKDFDDADIAPLKQWKLDPDPKNMWQAAFQIRQYARWLSSVYSLARYRQLSKDWQVPSEEDTPIPKWNAGEEDRMKASPEGPDYYETYATIRIMRDGSIVNMDGYGSATVMAGGNVHVSAAKHLTVEAAGDLNLIAGQDINIKARRNIEIAAVRGGLRLKARTWFHSFCEWGSYWVRSGAQDPNSGASPPTPTDATNDPEPIVLDQAIVLQSPAGGFSLEATNTAQIVVNKVGIPTKDVRLELFSQGTVKQTAADDFELTTRGELKFKSLTILASARNWYNQITGKFVIGRGFVVASMGRRVDVQRLCGVMVSAPTILGDERKGGSPEHGNHIGKIPTAGAAYTGQLETTNPAEDYASLPPQVRGPNPGNGSVPVGMGSDYTPDLVETLTQQKLRLETTDGYEDWIWSADRLIDPKVDQTKSVAWPGKDSEELQFDGGSPLGTPSSQTDFENKSPAPQRAGKVFKFLKRS